jgi:chromosome segregation ATPase
MNKVHLLQRKLDTLESQKRQLLKQQEIIREEGQEKFLTLEMEYFVQKKESQELQEKVEKMKSSINILQQMVTQQQESHQQLVEDKNQISERELKWKEKYSQGMEELEISHQKIVSLEEMIQKITNQQLAQERKFQENSEKILAEHSVTKELFSQAEHRLKSLQQEMLELSDRCQVLSKQLSSSENVKKQSQQMKFHLFQLDSENQEFRSQLHDLKLTLEIEKKLTMELTLEIEKKQEMLLEMSEKMSRYVKEMENVMNEKLEIEKDRCELRKENGRLRSNMMMCVEEVKRLKEIEKLYEGQVEMLSSSHCLKMELESELGRVRRRYHESVVGEVVRWEGKYGQMRRRYEEMLVRYHHLEMEREDGRGQWARVMRRMEEMRRRVRELEDEVKLAKEVEPFLVKKMNYLVAKLNGEKNHFENKVTPPLLLLSSPLPHPCPSLSSLRRRNHFPKICKGSCWQARHCKESSPG